MYTRVNWNSTTTYVSAENLNVMDKGIKDLDDAVGNIENLETDDKTNVVEAINSVNLGLTNLNNNLENVSMHYPYSGTQKIVNGEYAGIMQINSWGLVFDYVSPGVTHRLQIAPDGKIWHGMSNDNGITWQHGEHISNGWV